MKGNRSIAWILTIGLSFQLAAAAAQQSEVIGQVREVLKAGNAKELSRYLSTTIDVTIDGNVQSYSKTQAEFVFRDFFKQHPPSEFSIIHQGSSKGGQPFAIGQYKSNTETFRVFMKIKVADGKQLLHEISFSKE